MQNLLFSVTAGQIAGLTAIGLFATLLLFMFVNALRIRKPKITANKQTVELDSDILKQNLSQAIRIKTVSPNNLEEDTAVFYKFENYLQITFPLIHKHCEKTVINRHALVFCIKAKEATTLPIGFLAHQDVVPAEENNWDYPPFGGNIVKQDGEEYVYGRGSIDMKVHLLAIMEAMEYLIKTDYKFTRDVYMCFGFDEELSGRLGAYKIAEYLGEKNIRFEYILDEGGVMLDGNMLGIDGKVALIGNSEKGYADYTLTAKRDGGHSSSPVHPTSIEVLAKGISRLEKKQLPLRWTPSTIELFEQLTPHMRPLFKFICANRKLFSPLLKFVLSKINPAVEAVFRTTLAPTKIKGSAGFNIISQTASLNINCRMLPGDTKESVQKHIQKAVGKNIEVKWQPITEYDPPSKISGAESKSFQFIAKAINTTFDKLVPAPFPFIAASDAKFYYGISNNVYRFSPYPLTEEDSTRIHNANERMAVKNLAPAVNFFINLIKISCE